MTGKKPSKPWRVTVTGPEVTATSPFTSEAKAFAFVRASLGDDSPADSAKVEQWEGGRWWHFETVTADEIRAVQPRRPRRREVRTPTVQTGPTTPGRVVITPGSAPGCRSAEQIAQAVQHRLADDESVTVTDVVTIKTAPDDWTRSASQILHSIEVLLDPDEQTAVE